MEILVEDLQRYGDCFQRLQCVRVGGKFSESFTVEVGVRQGCVMSPWLFNIFMDGCLREIKCKVVNTGAKLRLNGEVWAVVTCLFADDTVLLARGIWRVVNEFYSICKRRKLKVNAGKGKVMVMVTNGQSDVNGGNGVEGRVGGTGGQGHMRRQGPGP